MANAAGANTLPPLNPPRRVDRRRNAVRDDLAAEALLGLVEAPRFVAGAERQVLRSAIPIRRSPRIDLALETEALFGERVMLYEEQDGWAWIQLVRDGYVGYARADALGRDLTQPTHRIKSIGTFVYPEANLKTPPLMHLSLNTEVTVIGTRVQYSELAGIGYVVTRHLAEKGKFALDFVEIAERLIGTPYLWGGRTRIGLDCSGLVQIAMEAAGLKCPRDSDMQAAEIGSAVLVPGDLEGLQRGDILYWPGHVAIMIDGVMMVHATVHHMSTIAEPVHEAVARIAREGDHLKVVRRPARLGA